MPKRVEIYILILTLCILETEQEEVGWDACLEDAAGCCAFYN